MNRTISKFMVDTVIGIAITCGANAQTKVGDNKDGGIVYWIDANGTHGLIADAQDLGKFPWEDAKDRCRQKGAGWRLPSKDELNKLYLNKDKVGGFTSVLYWSSDEYITPGLQAWFQNFRTGVQYYIFKVGSETVRAVRDF